MKYTIKFFCLILALLLMTYSLSACSNEKYEADLADLQSMTVAFQTQLEQYSSDNTETMNGVQELKDQLTALQTKIQETKPYGKKFEENFIALKTEFSDLRDSFEALKLSSFAVESKEITNYVILTVKGYGSMVIELYPDVAPITVANFQKLVSEKFYDGLIFHRIIENFMIQGGDPLGTGTGGSKDKIKGEFSANGIQNPLKHTNGVISMARSESKNSASSQFFICQGSQPHLDGKYAAFGQVIYGIELIDQIAAVKTDSSDKPLANVVISSIRFATLVK